MEVKLCGKIRTQFATKMKRLLISSKKEKVLTWGIWVPSGKKLKEWGQQFEIEKKSPKLISVNDCLITILNCLITSLITYHKSKLSISTICTSWCPAGQWESSVWWMNSEVMGHAYSDGPMPIFGIALIIFVAYSLHPYI